ncbi:LytTR family two component transcriptional regulator [Elizabethkingia sp. YR214]|uniref:LytR/AlgR family response regulator transcription factor n=1 Tax=Elizabethkingia sp. YR214 TaxID=2135667 RepID=UPI000D30FB1B|nr:LytTR family DNA-binding domain-containing protein [Elizabethkingia sp. YR214]PUB32734.1 LytTR family two component transcriptional regulator [Elizabethkingia sp. YR214]
MNCIIVDDEILAQDVLENYISRTPILNLLGKFENAFDLFKFLHSNTNIDLIFLDIKMPEMSGLELVSSLKNIPNIIYTTAYHDHALEAFNLNAIDYLLKPFSYERFLQGVSKAMSTKNLSQENTIAVMKDDKVFIKSDKKLIGINVNDILYVESQRNYFVIFMINKQKRVIHNTLIYLEDALQGYDNIIRVHRSFFINISMVKEVANNIATLEQDIHIPIGQIYRDQVMAKLKII